MSESRNSQLQEVVDYRLLIRESIKDRYVPHIARLVDTSVADYTQVGSIYDSFQAQYLTFSHATTSSPSQEVIDVSSLLQIYHMTVLRYYLCIP